MARLQQEGMEIDLPTGWEGRIFARPPRPGERTNHLLHAANFALPGDAGDYGGGAVELMRTGNIFVSLVDFGPESANTPLFAHQGLPLPIRTDQFDPNTLQRTLPGQSGTQLFFTAGGRGYCLYIVLGSHLLRGRLVPVVNDALRTLRLR
jgi:hypothetical protein